MVAKLTRREREIKPMFGHCSWRRAKPDKSLKTRANAGMDMRARVPPTDCVAFRFESR
jgi:hypothetical protein